MKVSHLNRPFPLRSGFSLLELLVVISIIGILAGLLFPAVTGVMNRVKLSRTENTAISLRNAINAYFTEYRRLPVESSSTSDGDIELISDSQLLDILCASPSAADEDGMNPRRIVFYSGRTARPLGEGKFYGGVRIDAEGSAELFDFWGEHYRVILDGNADGRVDKPSWDHRNPSHEITSTILVWSPGPDKKDASENEDNLKTW